MRGGDLLVGGPGARQRRRRERPEPVNPPLVGWRFLGVLILLGSLFGGLGVWKVKMVFSIRDREIETRRLQVITAQRRDRTKVLETRISQLQRGETLRSAALDGLGMSVPEPGTIETITVPEEVKIRWEEAAETIGEADQGKEKS